LKKILGAGPAGLCAAINLARAGEEVTVFEKRAGVGMRFHPNLQGLKYVDAPPGKFLRSLGLRCNVEFRYFGRCFFGTRSRDIELDIGRHKKIPFVVRGGQASLEYAMYREAEGLGVNFEFNSRAGIASSDIVATGGSGCDFAAQGMVFEDSDFPRTHFLAIFDDRYSPRGWYSYIFPISKDEIEFVNCVSQPHVRLLSQLTKKALEERKILRDFLGGKKALALFGGSGSAKLPKTARAGGKLYVGEAAGFQDPFMGFGIKHALVSGKLAADSIMGGSDYDAAWRKAILPDMKKDFARRFPMSLFGDRVVEFFMRKLEDGDVADISHAAPENFPAYRLAEEAFFRLECLKKSISGYW